MELSVIIPAYNEAKRIGDTLQVTCQWLGEHHRDAEVIVVDNRSGDGTSDVVRGYMQKWRNIRLIHEQRPGKGFAVAAGMLFATGRVRLFMDADNSTTIDQYEGMRHWLTEGYDIVIGSIAVRGSRILKGGREPFWRVLFGKAGNVWIQLWAVPGIWDTQRGFKVFSAKAANNIFSRLTTFGWLFDAEVLAIARARGYRIREVPIIWNNGSDTRVTVGSYLLSLFVAVKIALNRVRGIYLR